MGLGPAEGIMGEVLVLRWVLRMVLQRLKLEWWGGGCKTQEGETSRGPSLSLLTVTIFWHFLYWEWDKYLIHQLV